MPAISPAKLKIQADRLAKHFTQPAVFVRTMHALLTQYTDYTHRQGQSGTSLGLISSYNVPVIVLHYIVMALEPIIAKDIEGTLALCDRLWSEQHLEHRLLACMLLGQVPVSDPELIFVRLQKWIEPISEYSLMNILVEHGTKRLRAESPSTIMRLVEDCLSSSSEHVQQFGLRTLIAQIENPKFSNLPAVFRLIAPLVRSSPLTLRADLIELVEKLARRSPSETAYILHYCLDSEDNSDAAKITRRVLFLFSDEIKDSLKLVIKNRRKKADG